MSAPYQAMKAADGHFVMGYYTQADMPFYYWLATTYAISDRYFSSVIGPTWPNRDFLYACTSNGIRETGGGRDEHPAANIHGGEDWVRSPHALPTRMRCST